MFDYAEHCLPLDAGAYTGAFTFGQPQTLTVALVQAGEYTAAQGGLSAATPPGGLVLGAGPVFFAPGGDKRRASSGAEGGRVLCLALGGTAPVGLAAGLAGGPAVLHASSCPGAAAQIESLVESHTRLASAAASAGAYGLLCLLAEALSDTQGPPPLVAAALSEIQAHYADVYGVEELAAELGVSKSHLIRIFTAAVGIPPGRYLTGVRVENAKRMLLKDYSLDVVAGLCGFSGANYLCRVFRRACGESPAAWRRRAGTAAPAGEATVWEEQLYL